MQYGLCDISVIGYALDMHTAKLKRRAIDMFFLTILVLVMALPGLNGLPVIDRDEARYAQASVQMMETGDYVNIRFQDKARNKKPAGAYWAQTLSVKAFSDVKNRDIWAHRIPSVLAAILAVLATYFGGIRLLGREKALLGTALLATSMIFVFEAHIAKTDALLCGFSAATLASIGYLRNGGGRVSALVFWLALGCAVMIKGPILPLLILLCFVVLALWERNVSWMQPLKFWLGPLLFLMIILPWPILMWRETGSAFFSDSLGGDLLPKLKGGHEQHGGPIGYYALTTWLAFWPACLFLLPGLAVAIKAGLGKNGFDTQIAKSARLLLCWSLPFFILLELTPTKLPHYTLPLFPALALMTGMAVVTITKVGNYKFTRKIGAVLFVLFSLLLLTALLAAEAYYGEFPTIAFPVMAIAALAAIYAGVKLWRGAGRLALIGVICTAILTNVFTYQITLPNLQAMHISKRVETALQTAGIDLAHTNITSAQYKEPSLVYRLGTHIQLPDLKQHTAIFSPQINDIIILDRARNETKAYEEKLLQTMEMQNMCWQNLDTVNGFNYAKGRKVELALLQIQPCQAEPNPN